MNTLTDSRKGRTLILALAGVLALATGLYVATRMQPPAPPQLNQSTTRLPAPKVLQPFELVTHEGTPFTLDSLKDQWSFVFFGYTNCPDVCPTTLSVLNVVANKLGDNVDNLPNTRFYFVSVDPERDTPEKLQAFVPYFNEKFTGVTGSREQIDNLTKQLSILYVIGKPEATGGYLVDHTASILLLNPDGQFEAVFSPPLNPDNIATDFEKIARYRARIR
jgi:protein SCO1/2